MHARIKDVRKKYGLTQEQFAERIHLSQNYIALVETGKREPSARTLMDISREFNVSLNWLKTGEGCPETDSIDEVTAAFGDLAARKDPIIDGFILFLRSRTPEQLELIAQQMTECAHLLKQNNENKRD